MITLYHWGLEIIERPEIRESNRTLDFGKGFYLTSSESQACDWVKRRISDEAIAGFISIYGFSISAAQKALKVKIFDSPSDEWLDFVMSNRKIDGFAHDYDIVVGPVANDKVYTAFALYESGTISRDILRAELKTYRLVDQYLFHTAAALDYLNFQSAKKVEK